LEVEGFIGLWVYGLWVYCLWVYGLMGLLLMKVDKVDEG
jgi:hypothetical protein